MLKFKEVLLGATLLLSSVAATGSYAAEYPERPVKVVVAFAAGGGADIVARMIFEKIGKDFGGSFIIENKGGAGGIIGTSTVARATPDGYTLLLGQSGPNAINQTLYEDLPYDVLKDFKPITQLTSYPYVIAVHPKLAVNNIQELIEYAKKHPGDLSLSTAGVGSSAQLAAELFMREAGVKFTLVPYRGAGPALMDTVAGVVDMTFGDAASATSQAKAGGIKALAVTGAKRFPLLPDVPTVKESGLPGYEATAWHGIFAPAGTPVAITDKLGKAATKALAEPDVILKLQNSGLEPVGSTPEQFTVFVQQQVQKWSDVVKATGIKLQR